MTNSEQMLRALMLSACVIIYFILAFTFKFFLFSFSALELSPGSLGRIVTFVFFHLLSPVIVLVGLTTDAPANQRLPTSAKRTKKGRNLVVNLNGRYSGYIFDNGYGGQQRLAS